MAEKKSTKATTKAVKKSTAKKPSEMTVDELQTALATKHTDLLDAKRSHKAGELINPRVLTATRKEIARLHTAIAAAKKEEK